MKPGIMRKKEIPSERNPLTYLQLERCVHQHDKSVLRSNLELGPDRHYRNHDSVRVLTIKFNQFSNEIINEIHRSHFMIVCGLYS